MDAARERSDRNFARLADVEDDRIFAAIESLFKDRRAYLVKLRHGNAL
jgi:hypothetical protein